MYEYKFIKIHVGYKPFAFTQTLSEDYHKIIEEQTKEGWRLVQIFAPPIRGYGNAEYFEMIFEKEI